MRGGSRLVAIPLAIVALAALVALLDDEAGIRSWVRLRGDLSAAEARIARLEAEIAELEAEAEALRSDPLALEAAIRSDLELARPGETVVRLVGPPGALPGP